MQGTLQLVENDLLLDAVSFVVALSQVVNVLSQCSVKRVLHKTMQRLDDNLHSVLLLVAPNSEQRHDVRGFEHHDLRHGLADGNMRWLLLGCHEDVVAADAQHRIQMARTPQWHVHYVGVLHECDVHIGAVATRDADAGIVRCRKVHGLAVDLPV